MSRLFCIVGTSSPTIHVIFSIVRTLVKLNYSEPIVASANTVDELGIAFSSQSVRGGRPVLLISDFPQRDLISTLLSVQAPVAVCGDDLATIAHFSIATRNYSGVDAARFASMSLVNIEPLTCASPPFSTVINNPAMKISELIAALSQLFCLDVTDEMIHNTFASLSLDNSKATTLGCILDNYKPSLEAARTALARRGPLENELIELLGKEYNQVLRGNPIETVKWPPYALLQPDFPDRLTVGPIDLAGPARFIYYGPYFGLPGGVWSADLVIEVADCYSENIIVVDVNAGEVLSTVQATLPPQGVYGCRLTFELDDPSKPLEIRVRLLTGAIEGVLQMRNIVLHRGGAREDIRLEEYEYDQVS
jgi:hypothetical protein